MSKIPSLNLGSMRREGFAVPPPQQQPSGDTATPIDTPSSGEDERFTPEVTPVDETPAATDSCNAWELLGCHVEEITDVATLQSKLILAQRLFLALEERYAKAIESKERQLQALIHTMTSGARHSMPAPIPPFTIAALQSSTIPQQRPKGVRTVPKDRPRQYHDNASSRIRLAMAERRTPTEAVSARQYGVSYFTPRAAQPTSHTARPVPAYSARQSILTQHLQSPAPHETPSSLIKRYQPATKRSGRAVTPRY